MLRKSTDSTDHITAGCDGSGTGLVLSSDSEYEHQDSTEPTDGGAGGAAPVSEETGDSTEDETDGNGSAVSALASSADAGDGSAESASTDEPGCCVLS